MPRFSLLLMACVACVTCGLVYGSACTLSVTETSLAASAGHWTGSGCTGGSFVPGNGDTATLTGATLTIANGETWVIGSSPTSTPASAGTPALTLGTTGVIVVASGGTVRIRGDVLHGTSFSFATSVSVQVNGGGTWIWDATQNLAAQYGYRAFNDLNWRQYFGNGSSGSHCVITSDLTGGAKAGILGIQDNTFIHSLVLTFCDVSNIGTSAISMNYLRGSAGSFVAPLTVTSSTFTNCGSMSSNNETAVNISNSFFAGGLGMFDYQALPNPPDGSGSLTGNVFSGAINLSLWFTTGVVTGNYIGQNSAVGNTANVAGTLNNNLILNSQDFVFQVVAPTFNYFFENTTARDNPHFSLGSAATPSTVTSTVYESPDDVVTDTGEAYDTTDNPSGATNYTLQNSVVLPSKLFHGTSEFGSLVSGIANVTAFYHHDTIVAGSDAVQVDEGGATSATLDYRATIIVAPTSMEPKLLTETKASPKTNVCVPANCDYNLGFHTILTETCSGCTNQGNGYISAFTSTPGQHDLEIVQAKVVDPGFADSSRRVATWDTRYLHNAVGTPWATATSYSVGNIVSVTTAGVYNGLPINYICTVANTSGASTKPDSGASWRTVWEYASLADLRTAILTGTTYVDGSLPNCPSTAPCTPVQTLAKWVLRGWTPQQPLVYGYTYPGDTNPVTNLGAVQMNTPQAFVPVSND